ncbi:hypothetical protein CYY_008308 [Polysphondylium violaceum]|uniref:B-related factor 1 n=1 Tax=Polysphondylium violaceum TaxID=133409 RepID=A0A8J4V431_9MYCE|nr:hypothetical protein CYY_008308 [Polysphondylium violaceum]
MAKDKKCSDCGGVDFTSTNDGSSVCMACGTVLEAANIVSEITFGGDSSVVGTFVSATRRTNTGYRTLGRDSRAFSLDNARRRLEEIANSLKMKPHHVDSAQRSYELAMEHNFTKGRKTQLVAASCLYIVCRRERTPHLLIDFSEVLHINIFVLAHTFLELTKMLNIHLPVVDPSLYIPKFAHKLEFRDQVSNVIATANKLVARMNRDWLSVGRKPSGICGASLYIAAKIHGFRRSIKEIVRIVKIGESTLITRLEEFSQTPSALLKPSEFDTFDMEVECNPPAFDRAREKEKQKKKKKKSNNRKYLLMKVEKRTIRTKKSKGEQDDDDNVDGEDEEEEIEELIDDDEYEEDIDTSEEEEEEDSDESIDSDLDSDEIEDSDLDSDKESKKKRVKTRVKKEKLNSDEEDYDGVYNDIYEEIYLTKEEKKQYELENNIESEIQSRIKIFKEDEKIDLDNLPSTLEQEIKNNDIQIEKEKEEELKKKRKIGTTIYQSSNINNAPTIDLPLPVDPSIFNPTDTLENIDNDSDLDTYIERDKEEIRKKDIIWKELNHEWIVKNEEREREMEEDRLAGRPPRKRKVVNKKTAESAAIAAEEELKKRTRNAKLIEQLGFKNLNFNLLINPATASAAASSTNAPPVESQQQNIPEQYQGTGFVEPEEHLGSLISQNYHGDNYEDYED